MIAKHFIMLFVAFVDSVVAAAAAVVVDGNGRLMVNVVRSKFMFVFLSMYVCVCVFVYVAMLSMSLRVVVSCWCCCCLVEFVMQNDAYFGLWGCHQHHLHVFRSLFCCYVITLFILVLFTYQ